MGMMAVFFLFIIIPSAIFHEYAHGWMANQLGDPTAKYAGRLTLNPIVHIDKWGTLIMPLLLLVITQGSFMFAYAKPVPYNPYNLKSQKWGPAAVAAAGPISNLFLAFVFGQLMRYVPGGPLSMLLSVVVYANVLLAVFNLLPIPPLDGSKLLYAVLPDSMWKVKQILEQYGFFILLAFIMVGFSWIHPIINVIYLF
ncbi:MAG: site-2 protease family protein, partial [Candidatus Magasanikbacteria bacterium]|nr:site-2 protease family protein [Candidatus Magasanikbacteria bacterium]